MQAQHPELRESFHVIGGWFATVVGAVVTMVGGGMLLAQAITGEWPMDIEGREYPLGAEFAFAFFTFGQMTGFGGLNKATKRPMFKTLAILNACLLAGIVAVMCMQAGFNRDWSLTYQPFGVWFGVTLAVLLRRLLAYDSSSTDSLTDHLESQSSQDPTSHDPDSRETQSMTEKPLSSFFSRITRKDVKRALFVGVGVGLLPVVFFSVVILTQFKPKEGTEMAFLGVFVFLAFLMFATGGTVGMLFVVSLKGTMGKISSALSAEYEKFAQQVNGQIQTNSTSGRNRKSAYPNDIAFLHEGREALLEIIVEGSGDTRRTFTQLSFAWTKPTDFTCQVSSPLTFAIIGQLIGLQDIPLGWPEFDESFRVKGKNHYQIAEILTADIQAELLELRRWLDNERKLAVFGKRSILLKIEESRWELRIEHFLSTTAEITAFYDRARKVDAELQQVVYA